MFEQKIIFFITDGTSSLEGLRSNPLAKAEMTQGLSQIENPEERRVAVDLIVEYAKRPLILHSEGACFR